jgi:hypothetical protein
MPMLRRLLPHAQRAFFPAQKDDLWLRANAGPDVPMRDEVKPTTRLWIECADGPDLSLSARPS